MKRILAALVAAAALSILNSALAAQRDEEQNHADRVAEISAEVRGFSGLLIGRLVSKDIERGELMVTVDHVPAVWSGSKAARPRAAVGQTFLIEGVAGKWLDSLLLIRPGETLKVEVNHRRGDRFRFIPELLEKTTPFDPERYPLPPDNFRGFHGSVTGTIVEKDENSRQLIVDLEAVEADANSLAKQPDAGVGKRVIVVGFWVGKIRDTFDQLKVGQLVRAKVEHRVPESDHFRAMSVVRQDDRRSPQASSGFPAELTGFQGLVLGRLVSKDIERGEFTVAIDHVPRVWRTNKAERPRSAVGNTLAVEGVSGKWLDYLLLINIGESLLFEAQHRRGDRLVFPGELLEKAAPFDPEKYPSPPEEFRGFRGIVRGVVDQKLENHLELTLKILTVEKPFDGNTAKDPGSVIGKSVAVAGFWSPEFRRPYDSVREGDEVRVGLVHRTRQSDHFMLSNLFEVSD